MPILTLEQVKAHLRIDGAAEDDALTLLADVSEDLLLAQIGAAAMASPRARQAALLIVGHFHANRGDGEAKLPPALSYLVASLRESPVVLPSDDPSDEQESA